MRYASKFLCVYRVRPADDDEDEAHSDDLASDEELEVSYVELTDALDTRVGGRRGLGGKDEVDYLARAGTHQENSKSAMEKAGAIWAVYLDDESAKCFCTEVR